MPKLQFRTILKDFETIPNVLLGCLQYYLSEEGTDLCQNIKNILENNQITRIFLIGHSYNYFAAHIPFYYINQHNRECEIYEIDEFLKFYHFSLNSPPKDSIFIIISHSGESMQTLQCLEKLNSTGLAQELIWGITDNMKSPLALSTKMTLPMKSGEETVIGSKSYLSTILVLYFVSRIFLGLPAIPHKIEQEIKQLIFEMRFYAQDWEFHVESLTEFLGLNYDFLYFISKGSSLATAYQAAISCKSYTRTFAEGTNIGMFLHGPYQMVLRNPETFRCVLIISDESNLEETVRIIRIVSEKMGSGKVMLINNSRELSSLARSNNNVWVFEHTTKNSYLAPLFESIVIQYLMLDLALRKGVIEKK